MVRHYRTTVLPPREVRVLEPTLHCRCDLVVKDSSERVKGRFSQRRWRLSTWDGDCGARPGYWRDDKSDLVVEKLKA